ncbi:hypothetical protein [Weissella confusa]|uniref:hypothetical protein n=1 Tax=Weissella confusa TaxID=1583 RepID=UPI0018F1D452|nr:hypothetical protein [Weissella confusa]MBJ7697015.1 hypothetical protein [Weissella confusa]MCT0041395.1 hypothetical protein [Weissella confusa]WEY48742.1 hypothetical protein P3T51_03105 [Weissella confusa]
MSVKQEAYDAGWQLVKDELERQKTNKNPEMLEAISGLIEALGGLYVKDNGTITDDGLAGNTTNYSINMSGSAEIVNIAVHGSVNGYGATRVDGDISVNNSINVGGSLVINLNIAGNDTGDD